MDNRRRELSGKAWNSNRIQRLARADISADYVKQAYIPTVALSTTEDFVVQKQGLDINVFGIYNEGEGIYYSILLHTPGSAWLS